MVASITNFSNTYYLLLEGKSKVQNYNEPDNIILYTSAIVLILIHL